MGRWGVTESPFCRSARSKKLDLYLKVLYELLRDLLILGESGGEGEIHNQDIRGEVKRSPASCHFRGSARPSRRWMKSPSSSAATSRRPSRSMR